MYQQHFETTECWICIKKNRQTKKRRTFDKHSTVWLETIDSRRKGYDQTQWSVDTWTCCKETWIDHMSLREVMAGTIAEIDGTYGLQNLTEKKKALKFSCSLIISPSLDLWIVLIVIRRGDLILVTQNRNRMTRLRRFIVIWRPRPDVKINSNGDSAIRCEISDNVFYILFLIRNYQWKL